MSIQELCITEIFSSETHQTDFVKIEKYKYLRLAGFSDTCMYVELQFSHDCETVCFTKSLYLNGKNWIAESSIEPMLPYVRVKLKKADLLFPGTNLVIYVSGRMYSDLRSVSFGGSSSSSSKPESSPAMKRSFFMKKKEKEPEKIELTDYRFPTVLLKGSLLYVAGTNRIESIATGLPGDILMLDHDGKPFWTAH